jgi:restriction endonuclease S subunit
VFIVKKVASGLVDGKYRRHYSDLVESVIPLPPLSVQKEIVERLEKELGEADKVAAEFKRMLELADEEFKAELDETFNSLSANSASPREIKNDGCVGFVTRGAAEDAEKCPMVRLGDVCEVVAGQSPEGKYYTTDSSFVEFHQGCKAFGSKYLQSSNVYTKEITKVAGEGYIVMSVRAPVGTVNITQREICIGRGLCTFVLSNKIFREFLYFYLLASKKYLNDVAGAGTVFPSISRKQLMDIQIPLPSIEVQKEIVAKLDAAKERCEKLKAAAERGLTAAQNLRKAILSEAFEL